MFKIGSRHDGRSILFPILIFPPAPTNELKSIETLALLDTGATNSGVTPTIIDHLGLETHGKRPLGSARGEEQVPRFMFRIGFIPSGDGDNGPLLPYVFDEVDGFELRNSFRFGALIGMDLLRHCDFSMHRNGDWSLSFGG